MKTAVAVIFLMMLAGCSTLTPSNMGKVDYKLSPIVLNDGKVICCQAELFNTKNYDNLYFSLVRGEDGSMTAILKEGGVDSTNPAIVGAEANRVMAESIQKLIERIPLIP